VTVFFNKSRMAKLEKRVEKLEAAAKIPVATGRNEYSVMFGYTWPEVQYITAADAIQKIARHLNLEFTYQRATKESIDIQPAPKAKKKA
jgi:hypothetical protein